MNLIPPKGSVIYLSFPPPSMVVYRESIFYKTPLCTLLMTTDSPSVSPENHVIPNHATETENHVIPGNYQVI